MQTEREKKPKQRREPELPHCTQAIARGWPLLPPASFTLGGRKWWAPEGWGFWRWNACLGPTAAKGADPLRISALVLWAGIRETQGRWSGQAHPLHSSSWQPHVSAGLHAMGREDYWARKHRILGWEVCETDRWNLTQTMGQCPEALRLDDPLATEAQYF